MKIIKAKDYQQLSGQAFLIVKEAIKAKPNLVLGLSTGSTPLGLYQQLAGAYQRRELDFSQITTFNLDEYLGLTANDEQSYHFFMLQQLFGKVNLKPENIFIPDGETKEPDQHCLWYSRKIKEKGGIDLQILGIGRNSHLGFNEPGSSFNSRARVVNLSPATIDDNSRFFKDKKQVPRQAITMGLADIFEAKEIILLASGQNKAEAVKSALEGKVSEQCPASLLQKHPSAVFILDKPAASLLKK